MAMGGRFCHKELGGYYYKLDWNFGRYNRKKEV